VDGSSCQIGPWPGEDHAYSSGVVATGHGVLVACIASGVVVPSNIKPSYVLDMAGCDLAILNSGRAPVLLDHQEKVTSLVGVVVRAWVEDNHCYAEFRLGRTELAKNAALLIEDGILVSVSIGFMGVFEKQEYHGAPQRVARWRPYEVSLVPCPANWHSNIVGHTSIA
jgi:hypothetical protein